MSQVERFMKLPPAVQKEIAARLAANGYGDYEALERELRGRGYRISKSALHRAGQRLKSDAGFLHAWALANPARAAALAAGLRAGATVTLQGEGEGA